MNGADGIGGTDDGSLLAGSGLKAPLAVGGLTGLDSEQQATASVQDVAAQAQGQVDAGNAQAAILTPQHHAQGAIEHLWALAKHELSEADKAIVIECRRLLRGLGIRTGQG